LKIKNFGGGLFLSDFWRGTWVFDSAQEEKKRRPYIHGVGQRGDDIVAGKLTETNGTTPVTQRLTNPPLDAVTPAHRGFLVAADAMISQGLNLAASPHGYFP
jgi:hypothetical protein